MIRRLLYNYCAISEVELYPLILIGSGVVLALKWVPHS